jgi:diguanylate cyclase (GGDEF)-like protein/PAS domain S-box-containing protein
MKWYHRVPPIPGSVIALAAMLLGGISSAILVSNSPACAAWQHSIGSSVLWIVALVVTFFALVGIVILRELQDLQSKTDRDLLDAFLEHIPDNVFFKDRNSRFLRVSRAMADFFGVDDPERLVKKTDFDVFTTEHAGQAFDDEQKIISTGESLTGIEEKETWPDGHETWALTTKVPLRDRRGHTIGTMGISRDITDRKRAEMHIRYMALHDALTGLPNRILLEDLLAQSIAFASRTHKRVAIFMLDLDRFKYVNDSFGHQVGDRLLEAVSVRLRNTLRDSDIVARLGGDEFVVVLPAAERQEDIEYMAQKLLSALSKPFQIESHELQVGASIGVCDYPSYGENPRDLLQAADTAMYEAKKRGRGNYCFFVPELTDATRHRQKLESDLQHAFTRQEFVLYYQPLVSTTSSGITGVEALLRWRHPIQGLIFPNQFVPQLEEMGLMVDVGNWVLRTACMQNAEWQKAGFPPIRMMVNLSSTQFYRGNVVGAVKNALNESGLDPKCLELEVTELVMLDDSESTLEIMKSLKSLGVSLSLDDFGTGWSSLSYLRKFPVDRIKIDRSFLRDIASEPSAEAVVRSIIQLGRDLGLACVAEGVETTEQLNYFRRQNCEEVQGFLYSPAVSEGDCRALLRESTISFAQIRKALELGPAIAANAPQMLCQTAQPTL